MAAGVFRRSILFNARRAHKPAYIIYIYIRILNLNFIRTDSGYDNYSDDVISSDADINGVRRSRFYASPEIQYWRAAVPSEYRARSVPGSEFIIRFARSVQYIYIILSYNIRIHGGV